MNHEARDILLISVETGCRQNEIYNLPGVNDPIPHLSVENELSDDLDEWREVKNTASDRKIPLVAVALAAALRHPNGFPRYRKKASCSAAVNKYLRATDLLPAGVTVGGTRHTWESRIKKVRYDNDDRGELMGHSVKERRGREVYGDDMPLADRLLFSHKVALPVPKHLM